MANDIIRIDELPDAISIDSLPSAPAAKQAAPDVIKLDDMPDVIDLGSFPEAPAMPTEAPGMLAGAGSAMVRGYQDTQVQSGIAEKFRLRGYKTALENGGDFETDIGELIMSGKATPAQNDLFRRNVPRSAPEWRLAEIARVTNEIGKLDLAIKDAEATRQNFPAKSLPYQALQTDIEAAKKEGRPIMGTLESLWNNPAGVPEFVAEGAYGTAKPIAGAIAAAIALRRGQAAPVVQKLGPIAASMGITGIDSYKGQVAEMIEKKAREGGIDLRKKPEMMDGLLQDANFIEAVKTDALKAGLNDAAWAGISTWLGMTPRIKGIWQPVVQSAAEGGTELSKQLIVEGKVSDPSNVVMSTVAGAAFEGPTYGVARAAGAFGGNTATPPAAPQAQQQATPPPPPAPAPQAQTQQAAPDTIDIESLPSVAGETVEPAAAAPAPVEPVAPAPAPAQPQAAAQPAPVEPVAQPAPVVEPAATQPQPEPAPTPAQTQAATPVATQNVEPRPKIPDVDAPKAEWDAYWPVSKEWDAKHGKTHWNDGTPKRAEWIKGTPEYEAREARAREVEARRTAEQQAQAATPPVEQPDQPAAPAPVAVEPEPTPAPATQPVATAQPAAPAQTEIAGTENTFNLTGEQVAPPTTRTEDTTAEMPLAETRENPLATEARAQLRKLEAAGKGDSGQAQALRRTIERETKPAQPAQPAAQAEAPATAADEPNVDLAQDKDVSAETKAALAKANADVMAAFKKYGKKSQQYKDAQKAKKKIFEKALAEKSKALEAERDGEPAPIPSTPEREAKINAILDNAEAADQSYTYEIKPIYQLKGSDGKWYRPQGFPFGIKNTGEKRIEGYAAHNRDGISYGKVFATEAEAQAFQEDGRKARREEFRKSLEQSDDARLNDQAKFWEGERATFDRRNPEAAARRKKPAQPNLRTDAENAAPQSPQAEAAPAAEAAPVEQPKTEPVAEQPKPQPATQRNTDPSINEAAKAQKTDQPQTKRARTALRNALRQFGKDDLRTRKKYRAVLDALEREKAREARARDISQPYLGREEPADIKQARALLAKKSLATGGISSYDVAKANALIEQYEAEVDLSMGQLRDDGQIRLVSDETLDRVIAHVQGMIDAGKKPDADALNALKLAQDERVRRETDPGEEYGDPIADVRAIVRKSGGAVAIPDLPTSIFKDTEYSGLKENLPRDLSLKGGVFAEPFGGIDLERAKKDADYRNQIRDKAEGMLDDLHERLVELGWTQVEGGNDVVQLLQEAATGKPMVPAGGVGGASFKGDPNKVAKIHGGTINLDMLSSEGDFDTDPQNDTREPEPSDEEKQEALQMEVDYEDPRYDSQPSPADQAVLDAAADNAPTEQSILDALDKAARERLDPRNRNTLGPDLIAALMWQTARDIQRGVVSFAKWSADKARQFPSLKGSLKTIWAKAQDIAKRPMDYIRFRALDSIADKVWQNAARNKGSATLRKIANIVFAKAGPDADATENDIPTRVNLVRNQFSNIYAGIMERFAAEFADMTPEQRRQWDADFRKAVIEGTTPSDPKVAKAVADFRNLMRDMLEYQRNAGIDMGDQGGNYFPRNYDPDAVEADRDGFVAAAMEMYRKREERLLNRAINDVRRQEKERPADRKEADRKFGRKIKSDAEYRQEAAEWAQEKIAALEAEFEAKDDDYYKQKAEDWATAITHGDVLGLTLFKATDGKVTSDATDARTFTNDEAALADEFLKKNIDDIILGYIDGAVRGAELARVFGQDGKKFEQMMNQLSKEGVDAETIKETRRLVQKALGVGREQSSQATAAFFDWVNVVLAGAFLGKTFVYNLVLEPISFGIRTGNVYLALKGMADTWKYTLAEIAKPSPSMRQRIVAKYGSQKAFAKAVTETVGEQVGLIQNEMERSYFNAHWDYSSDEKGSRLAKWISQRIYRANLMSATEKAKVQASIGIARLALRDNARFFTGDAPIQKLFKALGFDVNADKSAAAIMRENGVPEKDHKAFAAWVAGLEGKTDAEWAAAVMDPKDPMAKHYRRALQRMSLGMSIKTNPALKMEMSDSILGRLMMQLMNYSYAYSNLVKDRMYSMAAQTVAKDASKIDRLRYAAPLLVGAPLAILGAAASKALIAGIWPSDDEEKRSKETPMVRKAFNWASFAGMFGPKVEYLFKSFERGQAPGGPVGETIFRSGQAVFSAAGDPDSEKKAFNAKKQLYNSTVKPVVTGAGAAAHPFFGFLGNAAVNTQGVRETFTGELPRK